MPFPNEHSARLKSPTMPKLRVRRTHGSGDGKVQGVSVPASIDVVWFIVKRDDEEVPIAQALRFPIKNWGESPARARKWLKDNGIKFILFEPAGEKMFDELREMIKEMEADAQERRSDDLVQCAYGSFEVVTDRSVPLPMKIQEATNPDRVIRFKASDDTIDRYNEVILPSGWDLKEFKKNPVMMQFHDHHSWPIGKCLAAGVVNDALMIDAEFDPPEVDESADLVFRKIKHGSVKAGSVGFLPKQWVYPGTNEKGVNTEELFQKYKGTDKIYIKQELLEWTICPIGANPNALAASLRSAYSKRYGHEPTGAPAATGSETTNAATTEVTERLGHISKLLGGKENE